MFDRRMEGFSNPVEDGSGGQKWGLGGSGGGSDPPQNGGRDSGFFWGSKNGQKWSKKVRDGGVSKSAVSGGRGGFSRKKNVGAWGAESLKILSPPPPGAAKYPPWGMTPPPLRPKIEKSGELA